MSTTANNAQVQQLQNNLNNIWDDIDRIMLRKEDALLCASVFTKAEWGFRYYMDIVEGLNKNLENLFWLRKVTKEQLFEAMG